MKPFRAALVVDGLPSASFSGSDVEEEFNRLTVQQPTQVGPVTIAVLDDTCGNLSARRAGLSTGRPAAIMVGPAALDERLAGPTAAGTASNRLPLGLLRAEPVPKERLADLFMECRSSTETDGAALEAFVDPVAETSQSVFGQLVARHEAGAADAHIHRPDQVEAVLPLEPTTREPIGA